MLAVLLATSVLAGAAHVASFAVHQRRGLAQQAAALEEAGNVMELLLAHPWDSLQTEAFTSLALSDSARRELPGGTVRVEITATEAPLPARRLLVEVRGSADSATHPATAPTARLVAWRFQPAETAR